MIFANLRACALAVLLCGCVSTPTLRSPDEVADSIGGNAVAYNQGYGRAISDQILLNILRARDRLPLYHLSMSGIVDDSHVQTQHQAQIGSLNFGGIGSPWGVGQFQEQRTVDESPGFTLNPFSSIENDHRARQFLPVSEQVFAHFWSNGWQREILMYVMVADLNVGRGHWTNTSSNYAMPCGQRIAAPTAPRRRAPAAERSAYAEALAAWQLTDRRCGFTWAVADLTSESGARIEACTTEEKRLDPACAIIRTEHARYRIRLRAVDDMIYYVGSIMRETPEEAAEREADDNPHAPRPAGAVALYNAKIRVRPPGIYPEDTANETAWNDIPRNAPLFRVSRAPQRRQPGYYAAEVRYRGDRLVAGPPNDRLCIVTRTQTCASASDDQKDASAAVLSLLSQLIIISQQAEAQIAPTPAPTARVR